MKREIVVPILCIALVVGMFSGCVQEPTSSVNNAPVADFSTTIDNKTVNFTDASTDADNDTLTYTWDFDDGNTSTSQNPTHPYADNGTYTVKLTVNDSKDEHLAEKSIVVGNVAPIADFAFVATNLTVNFTDASTDPNGDTTIASWVWDFNGDGTVDNETQAPITYTYDAAGTYNATLTVTDDYGLTANTTKEVTVTA